MKKILRYLEWIPFAISLGALVIYIVYTMQVKMNPAIIVTDSLINTLKAYLIIALVSLFIGLLIVLIKKVRKLMYTEVKETTTTEEKVIVKNDNVVYEEKKIVETPQNIVVEEPKIIETPTKTVKEEEKVVISEPIKETKIIEKTIVKEHSHEIKSAICPECNNYISKEAAICPHCGILFDDEVIRIIEKYDKKRYKPGKARRIAFANICLTILLIILILLICNMLYNKYSENIKNINYLTKRQ